MNSQLQSLAERAWQLHRRFRDQSWLVRPSAPVLYFGDRKAYAASQRKVITVGLNPSGVEFPANEPFQRFPGAENGDPDAYLKSLNGYFRIEPYTGWFNPAFEPILNGLDCSYYDGFAGVALHTDLCSPLATSPTWSKLPRDVREELKPEGVRLWQDLVRFLDPDVIIISVAKQYLALIEFPAADAWRCIYTVKRTNPYEVLARRIAINGDKSALMVSGRAANHPFGTVSKVDKGEIGKAIKNFSVE